MHRAGRTLLTGLWAAVLVAACRDEPPATPAADTTSSSSDGGSNDSETGDPPPSGGVPRPERPDVQTCHFEGWAPGLMPPLGFEAAAVPPLPGAAALTVGQDGVLLVGTDDGALWGIDPQDEVEPLRELDPGNGSPITGLARGTSNGIDAVFVRTRVSAPARTRVTRHTLDGPRSLDPNSALEAVSIDFDPDARRGAGLLLTDGMLWVPLGDGESDDHGGAADNPNAREGNLLRLDVSTLAFPYGYDLPADNPLAAEPLPASEAWAWGLRDPVGCMDDPVHDRLWCVDKGEAISEVSLVPPGSNLGWPRLEGSTCRYPGACDSIDTQLPVATYRHGSDGCGVGFGAVANGMDPDLDGAIVYGDLCSGRLRAARPLSEEHPSTRAIVGQLDPALVAMAADPEGGIWAIDTEGQLGRLVVERPPGLFPTSLAESQCFSGAGPFTPAADLIPYSINAPLWTDGSLKERYLVLPPGEQLAIQPDGRLRFPEGAILVKNFSYAFDVARPEVVTPVETRVMIRRSFAWEFHSYRWNDEGTEATLLDDGESRYMLAAVHGAPTVVRHTYPSRDECGYCHDNGDVRPLGPRLDQLSREIAYVDGPDDQLRALADIGLFDGPLPPAEPMADYRDPEADLEDRARAYLHTNCAHCHRPGGWTPPDLDMDLRWATSTPQTNLCGVPPQYSSTFSAEHRVSPGDPADSLVWLRLSNRGPWQMPPFATSIPDESGAVVREWIEGLSGCP